MKATTQAKSILILQGPNMNLVSLTPAAEESRITLDKINKCLRKEAQIIQQPLKTIQTNSESIAVTVLQRQRNKILGIIIFPGPWQQSGFVLKHTLELIKIPYITISTGEDVSILQGIDNILEEDIYKAGEIALSRLIDSI